MSSNESTVILPFTLQDPSHPTTPEEALWYEYLKRSHCHRCPEQADCDAEDFMSCEMPRLRKFFKCNCIVCIDDKKLRSILQISAKEIEERYESELVDRKKKLKPTEEQPAQGKLLKRLRKKAA